MIKYEYPKYDCIEMRMTNEEFSLIISALCNYYVDRVKDTQKILGNYRGFEQAMYGRDPEVFKAERYKEINGLGAILDVLHPVEKPVENVESEV